MKIGVTQIVLGDMSIDDTLGLCNDAGYECVELVFRPGKDLDPGLSESELAAVRGKCEAAGVVVGSVIATLPEGGNLLSMDAAERENRVKSLVRSLEIGGAVGANCTLLHPGQLSVEGTYEEAWDNLQAALKEVAPVAEQNGVAIGVENVWNKFLLSPKEMADFVDSVGCEWVGTYLDTANMMAYGYPEHWVRSLGSRLKKVHFKDFLRSEHRFVDLMDGDTDWAGLMKDLRAIGYDDCVIHEIGGDRETQIEMANRMKKIVAL